MIVELIIGVGVLLVALIILSRMLHVNSQWDRAVVLRLGKYNRTVEPGLFFTYPLIERVMLC